MLTSAVCHALDGGEIGTGENAAAERIQRGEPPGMFPMEMAPEESDDEALQAAFEDIKNTLELPSINSDYRTLGLWPEYLAVVWQKLKPQVTEDRYRQAADALRQIARDLAPSSPFPWT